MAAISEHGGVFALSNVSLPQGTVSARITEPAADDHLDPEKFAPNHYAAAWQCPGCGTFYSYFVSSCGCQRHRWQYSSSTITTTALPGTGDR